MEALSLQRVIRFGLFEVDLRARELRKQGVQVKLREQPFLILTALLERPGEVVTREELRGKLWPADTFVDFDNSVNAAVNRLREALGDSAENPRFIQTLPRHGYRFIAPVETGDHDSPAAVSPLPSPAREIPPVRRKIFFRNPWFWIVNILIAATLLSLGVYRGRSGRVARGPIAGTIQSIAVLPLENLTGDASQEYFADGMTDALITDLAGIKALKVISRTSTMQYKSVRKPLPQIARELSVDAIVEGTVVRSGERVRIDAQLIQASTDRHLWAKSYERNLRDVVVLQSEVARAIVQEIQVSVTPPERARLESSKPVNPEALEDYLKGCYYLDKRTSDGYAKAIAFFQQAIEKDPNYALPYVALAHTYQKMPHASLAPHEAVPKIEEAARKALELDSSLGYPHASLAVVRWRFNWDWQGAENEYQRALALGPNDADIYMSYSFFLAANNRYQEAIAAAQHAFELDPLSPTRRAYLGHAYLLARQYDPTIQELRKALVTSPEYVMAHWWLGHAYENAGQPREALSEFEKSVTLARDPLNLAGLGHAYAHFSRREDARRILAELERRSRHEYVTPYAIATVWIGLGDKKQGLAWLEKAYQDHSFQLIGINSWPEWDPLRSDPHFRDLVRRIGLDPDRAIPR